MSMTIAEARAEIKNLFEQAEKIENKYKNDPTQMPGEDLREVQRLLTEIDGLEEKLAVLENAEERKARILGGLERYNKPARSYREQFTDERSEGRRISPGDQFVNDAGYRELKTSGAFNSKLNRVSFVVNLKEGTSLIEWKTLLRAGSPSSGGALVERDRLPGIVDILQRELSLLDLIPRSSTESDTIEYVREDTFTNSAAMTAEATATTGTTGTKPESALAYSTQTATVRTLAHWIPVTNRMLADAPAIAGIVNGRLIVGLNLELENQIMTGDNTGENFAGLLTQAGVNIQGKGTDNELDAIFKARTQVRVIGRGRPNAVVLHPNDWQAIRLSRENVATATLGNYLMGPPSQVGAVTVWGIPVVETDVIPENTGLIGDFALGCMLFDREQAAIRVGTINDQFVRNMQTILAELRAAFVIWRPTMFTKITGI